MAMETVFSHNPTHPELDVLFPAPISKADYLALPRSEDSEFGAIFRLYSIRGNAEQAATYLAKVKNDRYRLNLAYVDTL